MPVTDECLETQPGRFLRYLHAALADIHLLSLTGNRKSRPFTLVPTCSISTPFLQLHTQVVLVTETEICTNSNICIKCGLFKESDPSVVHTQNIGKISIAICYPLKIGSTWLFLSVSREDSTSAWTLGPM